MSSGGAGVSPAAFAPVTPKTRRRDAGGTKSGAPFIPGSDPRLARYKNAALVWESRSCLALEELPECATRMGSRFLSDSFVFDLPVQAESREARIGFLRRTIQSWKSSLGLRTALDIGCGVGTFSAMLHDLGLQVTAADARAKNIEEARSRHPGIDFHVADVEDASLSRLGTFDLVICFGLLYHLENPLLAIRNIQAVTGKVLVLESMSVQEEQPVLFLLDEPAGEDQSLRAVSCYPSEGAMVKMCYRAGFPNVYRFRELPDHEDFRAGIGRARARTVIAASISAVDSPLVEMANEPKPSGDLWTTDPTGVTKVLRRLRRNMKQSRNKKAR